MVRKAVIVLTVASAVSPVDLIPEFIPVPGYPDDLIVAPAGIALAVRTVPESVLDKYLKRGETELRDPPGSPVGQGSLPSGALCSCRRKIFVPGSVTGMSGSGGHSFSQPSYPCRRNKTVP